MTRPGRFRRMSARSAPTRSTLRPAGPDHRRPPDLDRLAQPDRAGPDRHRGCDQRRRPDAAGRKHDRPAARRRRPGFVNAVAPGDITLGNVNAGELHRHLLERRRHCRLASFRPRPSSTSRRAAISALAMSPPTISTSTPAATSMAATSSPARRRAATPAARSPSAISRSASSRQAAPPEDGFAVGIAAAASITRRRRRRRRGDRLCHARQPHHRRPQCREPMC